MNIGNEINGAAGVTVWNAVRDSVYRSSTISVRVSMWSSVLDTVVDSVYNSVRDNIEREIRAYGKQESCNITDVQ
jgi:hypothetical protein